MLVQSLSVERPKGALTRPRCRSSGRIQGVEAATGSWSPPCPALKFTALKPMPRKFAHQLSLKVQWTLYYGLVPVADDCDGDQDGCQPLTALPRTVPQQTR